MIGKTISHYKIVDKIGEGGMGSVYKAEDASLGRLVAIKTLSHALADDLEAKERFVREAQAASALNHPNITVVHELIEHEGSHYICMEYVEGKTIRDMVETGRVSVRKAVDLISQAAEALERVHAKEILHRDIKSANIMVTMEGRVKIMDFGLAHLESRSQLTRTGTTMGTLAYSSPDQITGKPIDARSEVYSLGVVFYELLVGSLPFFATNEAELVFAIINNEAERPANLRDDVPEDIELILQRMMEKDPVLRYQSMSGVLEDLRSVRKDLETSTVRLSGARDQIEARRIRAAKRAQAIRRVFDRRWDLPVWQLAVAVAIVGTIGLFIGRSGRQTRTEPLQQINWFRVAAPLTNLTSRGSPVQIAPDGSRMVFLGRGATGNHQLFRRELDGSDIFPIPGTEGIIFGSLTISPDGRNVGYQGQDSYRTISIHGGRPLEIVTRAPTGRGAHWGPGDVIVYQSNQGSGLSMVSVGGGEARIITVPDSTLGEVGHRWPYVSPDGGSVVFTIWGGTISRSTIGFVSLSGGNHRSLLRGTSPVLVKEGYLIYVESDGILRAVGFDARSGELRGSPIALGTTVPIVSGAAQMSLSANGTLVIAGSDGSDYPVLVYRETGSVETLGLETGSYLSPRFSLDGSAFAISKDSDIWIQDFGLGTFSRLTFEGAFYPLWTPAGDRILFSRNEGLDVSIYEVPVDRSEDAAPVYQESGQYRTQSISPDGRYVMIRRSVGSRYELWVLDREEPEELQPWLISEFMERGPEFSPDGRWVAFSSDESGQDEVYVRPFPGPGGRIPVSTGGGSEPAWSHDSREIFYRSGDRMMVIGVEVEGRFRVLTSPRVLFEERFYSYAWNRQYDVTEDNTRFLMIQLEEGDKGLSVITNWFQGTVVPLTPP